MPTMEWLQQEFDYGYDSGNVLSVEPDPVRAKEERAIGGCYRTVFLKGVKPFLKKDSRVLELGPGRGSWSRAILETIGEGELHTVDFQDVRPWLHPESYGGRLVCHQVADNSFSAVPDGYFDLFWSFGVLCHNNQADIFEILRNALPKAKVGGVAVHQYSDWDKLDCYGWRRGTIPERFRTQGDDAIWWPRNNQEIMAKIAAAAGWKVIRADMELVERDSVILMVREK